MDEYRQTADDARQLHLTRLDDLFAKVYSRVKTGSETFELQILLGIMDRIAKYSGLDTAAVTFNVVIPWESLSTDELRRLAAGEEPRRVLRSRSAELTLA